MPEPEPEPPGQPRHVPKNVLKEVQNVRGVELTYARAKEIRDHMASLPCKVCSVYELLSSMPARYKEQVYSAAYQALMNDLPNPYVALCMVHGIGRCIGEILNVPPSFLSGDTYPLGCPFEVNAIQDSANLDDNDDVRDGVFSCGVGIYHAYCGFSSMEWMSDSEILYMCMCMSCHTLPDWALYVLRFCKFEAWYVHGAYAMYADAIDKAHAERLVQFARCLAMPVVPVSEGDEELICSILGEYIPSGIAVPCPP